ncbi:Als2 C-Terminal-Like Protein [Manis pentadactyla]|nr:Als2 C-Terminal-Like Protein [Manis pentadactyla]
MSSIFEWQVTTDCIHPGFAPTDDMQSVSTRKDPDSKPSVHVNDSVETGSARKGDIVRSTGKSSLSLAEAHGGKTLMWPPGINDQEFITQEVSSKPSRSQFP